MIIDELSYELPPENYVTTVTSKKFIVIGHTFNHDMRHIIGWKHRYNGKFKRTAAFTIDAAGFIYKHFDPKYYSRFLNNQELDTRTIVILLENDGWLTKNEDKNEFITWIGDIYKKPTDVVIRKWRGHTYWSPYTKEQLESAKNLVKKLCDEFSIPMTSMSHNTKIDNLLGYEGVLYKSNLERHFTDLSPAWDFLTFKETIEN